jgi:predicted Zn-dependent peptidase
MIGKFAEYSNFHANFFDQTGGMSDPKQYAGMAHLLEHIMSVYGSGKVVFIVQKRCS